MKRHYYISNDLDDLDALERELEATGFFKPQIHVLSNDDAGVDQHEHLHNIEAVFKMDVVHGTIVGALVGAVASVAVLAVAQISGWPATYTWVPFMFLSVVMLGFCTWAGGFYGIQAPHKDFRRFEGHLAEGKHIFIVDVDPEQESALEKVVSGHPRLELAGTGSATPRWVVMGQQQVKTFTSESFP